MNDHSQSLSPPLRIRQATRVASHFSDQSPATVGANTTLGPRPQQLGQGTALHFSPNVSVSSSSGPAAQNTSDCEALRSNPRGLVRICRQDLFSRIQDQSEPSRCATGSHRTAVVAPNNSGTVNAEINDPAGDYMDIDESSEDDEDGAAESDESLAHAFDSLDDGALLQFRPTQRDTTVSFLADPREIDPSSWSRKKHNEAPYLSAILVTRGSPCVVPGGETLDSNLVRYLPLGRTSRRSKHDKKYLTILWGHRKGIDAATRAARTSGRATWPQGEVPVEIFEQIASYLPRDDVKTMRLVNHEFEKKVSCWLFHTSVVPFNSELYDMIDENADGIARKYMPASNGKNTYVNGADSDTMAKALQWLNARDDKDGKVYRGHGLRVFRGFGPYVKRFGMSFEVTEKQLFRPPEKSSLDTIDSYHGSYDWPLHQYARFANLAGLERHADETSRMKAAFSHLTSVQELALSLDCGMGWLNGPDKSIRARILERPSPVFGDTNDVLESQYQAAMDLWAALRGSEKSLAYGDDNKETVLAYRPICKTPGQLQGLHGTRFEQTTHWPTIDLARITPEVDPDGLAAGPHLGVIFSTPGGNRGRTVVDKSYSILPADLKREQKEWLLEMEWAQRAFLESYMLSIIDNPDPFHRVTSLKIARISSRFLPMISRPEFWEALPSLEDIKFNVIPDWRSVDKDCAGVAALSSVRPASAVDQVHTKILQGCIAPRVSIKKVQFGWVGGGENAEGLFARNYHLLPAPIVRLDSSTSHTPQSSLVFKHVQHLTISNCWMTPILLESLIASHAKYALRKLTLDSVSLTADTSALPPGLVIVPGAAIATLTAANNANPAHAHINPDLQAFWQTQLNPFTGMPAHHDVDTNTPLPPPAHHTQHAPIMEALESSDRGTEGYRTGSWADILNRCSPNAGALDKFTGEWSSPPSFPSAPTHRLRSNPNLTILELVSCGYAKLPNQMPFDQSALEPEWSRNHIPTLWFRMRYSSLKPAMMDIIDRHMARIIQHISPEELDALDLKWNLHEGWADPSRAEEAEYDGFLPGGTGRISGVIERGVGPTWT